MNEDFKYYEVTDQKLLAACIEEHRAEKSRLGNMTRWLKKNLPGVKSTGYRLVVDPRSGLIAVECNGEIPDGFKRYGPNKYDELIAPKMSTKRGKEVIKIWREFRSGDWSEVLKAFKINPLEICSNLSMWKPVVDVCGERAFLVASKEYKRPGLKPVKKWEYEKALDESASPRKKK